MLKSTIENKYRGYTGEVVVELSDQVTVNASLERGLDINMIKKGIILTICKCI